VAVVESMRVWARLRASWREEPGPSGAGMLLREEAVVAKAERPRGAEGGREYLSDVRRIWALSVGRQTA
jgi:hypothetical protein